MKKILFILSVFFFFSCGDMLEIKPKGTIILSTTEEYSELLDDINFHFYDLELTWSSCFDAGHLASSVEGAKAAIMRRVNYLGLDEDRITDFRNADLYNACYRRISRCNIIIDNVMDSEGTESEKLKAIAEAKVLRAYNHFTLVNVFAKHYDKNTAATDGGILLRLKFSMEEEPLQATVEKVYQCIEQDINEAIPNLPNARGINVNHPGLAFAYALKAKVHLFKHEFAAAKSSALSSLEHCDYIFDWVAWDKLSPVPPILYTNEENLYFGYSYSPMDPFGTGIGPRLFDLYTPGDLRYLRFFSQTGLSYFLPKCNPYGSTRTDPRTIKYNVGGMKVSEVKLILAECYAREDNIDEAMEIVNEIRRKRIQAEYYEDLEATDKEDAFWQVMNEKSRELPLTPNNFYDVRRLESEGIRQSVDRIMSDSTIIKVASNSHVYVIPFPANALEYAGGRLKNNTDK